MNLVLAEGGQANGVLWLVVGGWCCLLVQWLALSLAAFQPQSPTELDLVHQLAAAHWRIVRGTASWHQIRQMATIRQMIAGAKRAFSFLILSDNG